MYVVLVYVRHLRNVEQPLMVVVAMVSLFTEVTGKCAVPVTESLLSSSY